MTSGSLIFGRQTPDSEVVSATAPDCSVHLAWPWHKRFASSAHRRVRALWRRMRGHQQPRAVERAVAWLKRQDRYCGLPTRAGGPACPGLTAAILPTLLDFGQIELVRGWSNWLLSRQLPDGSFPRSDVQGSSTFNTAQALRAICELTAAGVIDDIQAARRAAQYLARRLTVSKTAREPMFLLRMASELCCLPPLVAAARQLGTPEWQRVADRLAAQARGVVDGRLWSCSMRLVPYVAEAWLESGESQLAAEAMRGPSAAQTRGGAVTSNSSGRWVDHVMLAHLISLWYRLGNRIQADRALTYLTNRQSASGGWSENCGRGCQGRESAWVVKHYLDAVQWQVASSFAEGGRELPRSIASDDGRLVAVDEWLATLDKAAHVADAGCGSGRFLRTLLRHYPDMRFVGIDPASSLLERFPVECEPRHGALLRLPAADGELDGVFAVESLEHALLPQQAVDELCRVVRPGGRLLIIDKHAARQPYSLHEPWERWFLPETVCKWLLAHCHDIRCRSIAHGPNARHTGLFLCLEAIRNG
ncbi:MAG: methyltransferase domain-containing protein [Pirellulales bacterium]